MKVNLSSSNISDFYKINKRKEINIKIKDFEPV
jgi:hypothetical protein